MLLIQDVYTLSRRFPLDERFALTQQLRRSVISIAANIGEGARRRHRRVFLNHLDIALGSQGEVDVQLEIAARLGYLSPANHAQVADRVNRVGRMLNGLIRSLQPGDENH